jgi:dienelactone hydrolase
MAHEDAPSVRRYEEQRWLIDTVIGTVGVEWDQARVVYMSGPGGVEALAEFRATAARIQKFADIDREFVTQARRREAKAKAAEDAGNRVSARESYFIASLLWATARWPIHSATEALLEMEVKMNECFDKFIQFADRPIERVEIPFGDQFLPAYLHLPHSPKDGESFPCIVTSQGMDGCKETAVAIYGDKALERGIAVLGLDGPGQGECFSRRVLVTATNPGAAVTAAYDWLEARPEIDSDRLGFRGTSFGSYFGAVAAAALGDRMKACVLAAVCQEPGCNTIFNQASPTFKMRFMYMAGYTDEAEFDEFCKSIDLRPIAGDITADVLTVAGSDDELSPIEHTYDLMARIKSPKKLIVYEGARHGLWQATSVAAGKNPHNAIADWLEERLIKGGGMASEQVHVDPLGRETVTPY